MLFVLGIIVIGLFGLVLGPLCYDSPGSPNSICKVVRSQLVAAALLSIGVTVAIGACIKHARYVSSTKHIKLLRIWVSKSSLDFLLRKLQHLARSLKIVVYSLIQGRIQGRHSPPLRDLTPCRPKGSPFSIIFRYPFLADFRKAWRFSNGSLGENVN